MALSVGIVGCGVIGRAHLEHFTSYNRVKLVAVADLINERAAAAAAEFSPEKTFAEGRDLIHDSSVEAVVLAAPAEQRYDLAREALRAGKHVLIEKPVARSTAEVDEYLALASPDQIVAVASSRFRFTFTYNALRDALHEGTVAPVRQIIHEGLKPIPEPPTDPPPSWRLSHTQNGGGIMSNWGCYDLDYLMSLLPEDDRATEVGASIRPVSQAIERWVAPGSDAETYVSVMLRFASGTTVHVNRGEFLPLESGRNETIVLGDSASIRAHMVSTDGSVSVTRYTADGAATEEVSNTTEGYDNFHAGMIRDFVDAALDGRKPATGLERARVIQRITDAIYQSARENRSITL
ncbi:MAG: Gfo/Idh/MocA family protein [Spirochaetales bacterium]